MLKVATYWTLSNSGQEKTPREIMALRLIESLERLAENTKTSTGEPQLLRQIGQIRQQLDSYDNEETDETAAANNPLR